MKCKPGDIAIILHGDERGSHCTCVDLLSVAPGQNDLAAWIDFVWAPVWVVDRQIKWLWCGEEYWVPYVPDRELMPIGNKETPVVVEDEATV